MLLLVICWTFSAGVALAQTTATQLAVTFDFSPAEVPDAAVRSVVAQIQALETKIHEYAAVAEMEMDLAGEKVLLRDQVAFRRPFLFTEKKTVIQHPVAALAGQVQWKTNDGTWIWHYYQDRPGAREEAEKTYRGKMPDEALAQILESAFGPQARRYSSARVGAEPRGPSRVMDAWNIHDALTDLDPASLKLAGESADEWVLAGASEQKDYVAKVNVSKADGTARRVEIAGAAAQPANKVVVTIRDVKLNPSPALDSKIFQFSPPAGIEFPDETERLIGAWRAGGQ